MERLYRSRSIRIIAGVAGGMSQYFDVDVTVVRLLWVIGCLAFGSGILVYLIAWLIIPEENSLSNTNPEEVVDLEPDRKSDAGYTARHDRRRKSAGLLLIGLGVIFLAQAYIPWRLFHNMWPLLLILGGILLLIWERKD
jgi:phage shock protein PspC (stress-responsive transcriptional regulator)